MDLPDGWERWPQDAKSRLLAAIRAADTDRHRVPFYCTRPVCDGNPHDRWTDYHARAAQRPTVGDWTVWLILAGRGFGKTRTGAEWSWRMARHYPRGALVGRSAGDVRDTLVEGKAGILACAPATFRPKYEPSKRRLTFPNGAILTTFSADEPDQLRGPEHDYAWGDEWAAWRHLEDATDNLMMGLRSGPARALLTTPPKPRKRIREVLADAHTLVTRGTTYENLVNLAETFQRQVLARYEGTQAGRQELNAELLDDVQGALWNGDMIAAARRDWTDSLRQPGEPAGVTVPEVAALLPRLVVAVDPAATHGPDSDETGVILTGVSARNVCPVCGPVADGPHGFVLEDWSGRYTPNGWAARAVAAYDRLRADAIVGETNNGGDMVEATVHTVSRSARYRGVHASRGKQARAEPVAALYQQGRIHHAPGLDTLEEQMRTWVPGEPSEDSPDRMDATVWGLSDLMLEERGGFASAA